MGVITSGSEFNWSKAERAAQAIAKACFDAGFVPPECVGQHRLLVERVCNEIQDIVEALQLVRNATVEP